MTELTTLERLAEKAGRLYSLPAVAAKVLELTSSPDVDTHALKECIENDPALAAKVLSVVNSSLYGLAREVSDLSQAIALLGTKPLKLLVLGFSLPPKMFSGAVGQILPWYWKHTLVKAVAARDFGEAVSRQSGDEAFIAGLLQDLGMLVLIQELGEPYVNFLGKWGRIGIAEKTGAGDSEPVPVFSECDLWALESEAIGFDHTELSSRLLHRWGLPETMVQAVRSLRAAGTAGSLAAESLRRVLELASMAASLLANERPDILADLTDAASHEGIPAADLERLLAGLEQKVRQLADVLGLEFSAETDYQELLLQAHRQLAETAAELAGGMVRDRLAGWPAPPREEGLLDEIASLSHAIARSTQRFGEPSPEAAAPVPSAASAATLRPVERPRSPQKTERASPDPGLLGRLGAAVSLCRQARRPLSLLLVELDHVEDLIFHHSLEGFERLRRLVEAACRSLDHRGAECLPYQDAGFALILPDCERQPATQLGSQLLDQVRALAVRGTKGRPAALSLGLGVATLSLVPKNFPAEDLLAGAQRCLYGSHASGGGVVKSIEIY